MCRSERSVNCPDVQRAQERWTWGRARSSWLDHPGRNPENQSDCCRAPGSLMYKWRRSCEFASITERRGSSSTAGPGSSGASARTEFRQCECRDVRVIGHIVGQNLVEISARSRMRLLLMPWNRPIWIDASGKVFFPLLAEQQEPADRRGPADPDGWSRGAAAADLRGEGVEPGRTTLKPLGSRSLQSRDPVLSLIRFARRSSRSGGSSTPRRT